jgi:DNA-binding NtrC family response regulator
VPESLFESEFFGHEKGAFTGAAARRLGRFEQASGGTLFLDEVGELSLAAQAKLLRVIETRSFYRLGGREAISSDFRLVCATRRDMREEVAAGRFREDLFYRLAVFEIVLPPLRERGNDILTLADHFIAVGAERFGLPAARLSVEAVAALARFRWPGNVRQLENSIYRALVLCSGQTIKAEDFRDICAPVDAPPPATVRPGPALSGRLDDVQRETMRQAILSAGLNLTQAIKSLGMTRTRFYRHLKKFDLVDWLSEERTLRRDVK